MKHNTLHKAFPIVAAAIGDRFGIHVNVGGNEAYTDGKLIQLPAYHGNDANYHAVAWGVLAHEAAHIRYSDFSIDYGPSVLRRRLAGAIEDVRIEHALANEFPGTRLTLSRVVTYMIEQGQFRAYTNTEHPANVLYGYVLKRLRVQVLGQVALQPLLTQNEQVFTRLFSPRTLKHLQPLLLQVPHNLQSEQDSLALADRILAMLNDVAKQEPKSPNPMPQAENSVAGNADQETSAQDSQANAESSDFDGLKIKPQNTEQQKPGTCEQVTEAANAISEDDCHEKVTVENPDVVANLRNALSTTEASVIDQDVFETLKDTLALPEQSMTTQLMPLGCEPPLKVDAGLRLLERVTGESRKMRATLQGLVQAERLTHRFPTAHGTRINTQRLARVGLGETKLFLKSELKAAPNTALHMVLDRSYSMNTGLLDVGGKPSGTRLSMTLSASLALALALEGVPGVNVGITAFPGQAPNSVYRLLPHGQRVKTRASAFTLSASGGTPMTEALWFGAAALLRCREPRKVLLVLTDGQPDELTSTLDILQRCQDSGIDVVGIGLGVEVGHLFPVALRINALTELRTQLFALSKALLVAK